MKLTETRLTILAVAAVAIVWATSGRADGPGAPEIEPPVTVAPPYEPSCDSLRDRIIWHLDCDRPERVETCRAYEQPERANRFVVEKLADGRRVKRWTWGPGEAAAWRRAEARICGEGGNDHHSP